MILTYFALLIPAFSLLCSPPPLSLRLHPAYNALLPTLIAIHIFTFSLAVNLAILRIANLLLKT